MTQSLEKPRLVWRFNVFDALVATLFGIKVAGLATYSWWIVLSPYLVPIVAVLTVAVLGALVKGVAVLGRKLLGG